MSLEIEIENKSEQSSMSINYHQFRGWLFSDYALFYQIFKLDFLSMEMGSVVFYK